MTWKMFLDDERFPAGDQYAIVRSSNKAIQAVQAAGMPITIAFDHDLGGDDTTMVFLNWLTEEIIDGKLSFPEGFTYSIHSQNPIGAANIDGWMKNLIKHFPGDIKTAVAETYTLND